MTTRIPLLLAALASFWISSASAAITPLGVSLFPPVQFPPSNFSVVGLRLNLLWGQHQGVAGFDLGAVGNITTHDLTALQVGGLFNLNRGESTVLGLQFAGLGNFNTGKVKIFGLQLSAGVNSNQAEGFVLGFQVAPVNLCPHTVVGGAQIGLYNSALSVSGLQIGLINQVQTLHGLQIGLLNFNAQGIFSVSPILNFGF